MPYAFLDVRKTESFLEVILNNPARRNPLSSEMISELVSVLATPEAMDAQGIIIAASGPVFSAGHDFSDMMDKELDALRDLMHVCAHLMQSLQLMPQPVLAKVQGPAMAAGCQLALSCDLVVASENAFFQTPGGKSGWFCFTPMVALTRSIGRKRAFEMLMSGEPVPAKTAYEWGMINRVVAPERLDKEALDLMGKVTQGSPQLRAMGKKAFYTQIEMPQDHAYRYATDMMALTGITEDPQERMKAFVEKRPPVFKHQKKNDAAPETGQENE
ncbi:MAG: enoyl-CoA hydratase/isomerase family protein [Desulfobacterales bacterium]|nr:enoyl-CoA hydratase/isomerase family protein [Desulfobacterales bacterium]